MRALFASVMRGERLRLVRYLFGLRAAELVS